LRASREPSAPSLLYTSGSGAYLSMGTSIFVGKSQQSRQTPPPAHVTCTVAAVLLKGLSVGRSICLVH
jgi:hypothetical protein